MLYNIDGIPFGLPEVDVFPSVLEFLDVDELPRFGSDNLNSTLLASPLLIILEGSVPDPTGKQKCKYNIFNHAMIF